MLMDFGAVPKVGPRAVVEQRVAAAAGEATLVPPDEVVRAVRLRASAAAVAEGQAGASVHPGGPVSIRFKFRFVLFCFALRAQISY